MTTYTKPSQVFRKAIELKIRQVKDAYSIKRKSDGSVGYCASGLFSRWLPSRGVSKDKASALQEIAVKIIGEAGLGGLVTLNDHNGWRFAKYAKLLEAHGQ